MATSSGLLRERVLQALACPHCAEGLAVDGGSLLCPRGHRFDLARQGYANLLQAGASTGTADTADMVAARERFLAGGWFAPLTEALADAARSTAKAPAGLAVDLGAGTGHHLAAVLESLPGWDGLAVDLSKHAARRAARAHPRMGAIVADTWRRLPIRDGAADLVIATFAPREISEVSRILAAKGAFLLATPAPEHLAELVVDAGLLTVDPLKQQRLERSTAGRLVATDHRQVREVLSLPGEAVADLIAMGPSARHVSAPRPSSGVMAVTLAVDLTTYRHAQAA